MGVRGLKSYIEGNPAFLKQCNFKHSKLIIDGPNLCNILYDHSKCDCLHGGDYYAFETVIKNFFSSLRNCHIQAFVIFDGGSDHTNKKLDTSRKRAKERMRKANCVARGLKRCFVLPPLAEQVFIQTLVSLKIPYVKCLEEADWEIAALANQWACPVLSDDSDFFIFKLKAGVLPITSFQWEIGASQKYIPAKVFTVSAFCKCFNNLNSQMLPLLAALAGNDYVQIAETDISIRWEQYTTKSGDQARIEGILHWLSGFRGPKIAIRAVLNLLLDQTARDPVRSALLASLKEYHLTQGYLDQFFLRHTPPSNLPEELQPLPDWVRLHVMEGHLSSTVIDVLVLQQIRLRCQVEDFELTSCKATSRPIRQVFYGLLLSGQKQRKDRCPTVSLLDPGEVYVEEQDRQEMTLVTVWVKAACPASGKYLQLEHLNKAPKASRLQVLYETLGVMTPISTHVAAKLQLPVYATCYWLRKAEPPPQIEHLWALLLGLVFGELCGRYRGQQGIALVWNRLNNLRRFSSMGHLDLQAVQTYSQWQGCLEATHRLNQLLCSPMPGPEFSRLYSGPLVHQAAFQLKRGKEPESFLSGCPLAIQLFQNLQAAVLGSLEAEVQDRLAQTGQSNRTAKSSGASIEDFGKRFSEIRVEEEDEHETYCDRSSKAKVEEENLWRITCIRTRHKKKSSSQSIHRPSQSKKGERGFGDI